MSLRYKCGIYFSLFSTKVKITLPYLSRTKNTVIIDVVIVMWAEGCERAERGKSLRVGQLLLDMGPGWMEIRHHEQEAGPPSK
jgi:hypothetical protein